MGNGPETITTEPGGLADPAWYRATSLHERVAAGGFRLAMSDPDPERTARRLARWREEPTFEGSQDRFVSRLIDDGLTEDRLRELLAEPAEALRARLLAQWGDPPAWLTELAKAFGPGEPGSFDLPELLAHNAAQMLFLVEPVIARAADDLKDAVDRLAAAHPGLVDARSVVTSMLRYLCGRLLATLSRTAILELQVARLDGCLKGDTPQERFADFVRGLRDRDTALRILGEYPVLAQAAVTTTRLWAAASLEFVERLATDRAEIVTRFFRGQDPGPLVEVDTGVGDPHRGGRTVCILRFASGGRLVYKPRSLSVDRHFQELLQWLNDRGADPDHRTLTLLDREEHGWVEYVEAKPCDTQEQVERFYRRQGGYLALLYCLHAVDFHYENLIASGEHPVLVDLEALFHPNRQSFGKAPVDAAAVIALDSSVIMTGLLPQRRVPDDTDSEPGEFSGLGGADGQLSPVSVASLADPATDEMRITRMRVEMPAGQHRATVSGAAVDVLDHIEDVLYGFESACGLLRRHREELLAPGGPLEAFADDEVRCVVRPTHAYAAMLSEGTHPDLLRDGLARDRYFDNLWSPGEENSVLNAVFPCERHDLYRGDIPVFTMRPGRRHLWCAEHHVHQDGVREPVLDMVRRRIARLDDEDVQRQAWIIRASFIALILGEGRAKWPVCEVAEPERPAETHELLAAACEVGDRLELLAFGDGESLGWIGLSLLGERVWAVEALGGDLYGGLSGIALFLGYLGEVSGDPRYEDLAGRALEAVRKYTRWRVEQLAQEDDPQLSTFENAPGGIFTMIHLGVIWDRADLLDEAEELTHRLAPYIERSRTYDIINGTAGLLCVLLALHRVRPGPKTLDMAMRCGDLLLATSEPMPHGIAWREGDVDTRPLAGFSHGASGPAYALLRLAGAAGADRFRTAADQAMAYERSLRNAEEGNWPDLREVDPALTAKGVRRGSVFMTAWCHGAPGIGLTRAHACATASGPHVREELDTAIETTMRNGLTQNHSLCHGALGNLELLSTAAQELDSDELRQRTRWAARRLLDSIEKFGWQCGVPGGVETPGLMTGLAGIGYGLLRLAEPHRVPSVLTLSAPVTS